MVLWVRLEVLPRLQEEKRRDAQEIARREIKCRESSSPNGWARHSRREHSKRKNEWKPWNVMKKFSIGYNKPLFKIVLPNMDN